MNLYQIADIADALGARPELVRQWKARGKLPEPSGRVGQSPWWEAGVIEPWIRQTLADLEDDDGGDAWGDGRL